MKVLGVLANLMGMTNHSNGPSGVLKVMFYSSSSLTLNGWYPALRSILEKHLHPTIWSIISLSLGLVNPYFIVILLIALLSIHILHDPSFLGVKRARTT